MMIEALMRGPTPKGAGAWDEAKGALLGRWPRTPGMESLEARVRGKSQ